MIGQLLGKALGLMNGLSSQVVEDWHDGGQVFRFLGESMGVFAGDYQDPHHSADAEYVHTLDPEFYPGRQGSQWRICSPAGQIDPPLFLPLAQWIH